MLLNCDFERHGFFANNSSPVSEIWYTRYPQSDYDLNVIRARKGMKKVILSKMGKFIATEIMWSPEQLRLFLLFHKVIEDNKKL